MAKLLGACAIVGVVVLVIALYIFSGFVFMFVWNLFVPQLFHAPVLNVWHGTGIVFLLSFIGKVSSSKKD